MKKIILSAASLAVAAVASVSVAPTTSEAIPAFARQTGSACLACHFQSFPTLNAYGRSFKMGGLTDSSRDLVEDEGLSIPATLNWTVMVRPRFQTVDTGTKANAFEFADPVFMIAGRAGEHTGVFVEYGAGGIYANAQMINSYDMGDLKVGASVFSAGFGSDAGMQVMSVWGQHGGLLGGKSLTINGAMDGFSNGVTAWAGNETWVAQLAMVNAVDSAEAAPQTNFRFAPVLRGNYFLEAGDFEIGLGAIVATGSAGAGGTTDQKRTGIDVQAMGEVADMQVGVFADWATAPAGTATASNIYNPNIGGVAPADARTGYSFRATVKPTHNLIFMAGLGQDKTSATTIDKTLVGVEYEVYQNGVINFTYGSDKDSAANLTTKTTTLEYELLI